jgi:hypothetical protein
MFWEVQDDDGTRALTLFSPGIPGEKKTGRSHD